LFAGLGERMVLAADWDGGSLRLVHAGLKKGKVRIERMLSVDMPRDVDVADPESVGRLIRQVLDQQRIRTQRVVLDVPRDQALLTTLKLPVAPREEMPAVVTFQIAKELPFSLSSAVVDYASPSEAVGQIADVLVGTVRQGIVSYYRKTCDAAGLRIERLGFRPNANMVAVNELLGKGLYSRVVMVDVGPTLTEIDIISDGYLAFSRAASVAVRRIAESDKGADPGPTGTAEVEDESSAIIQFPAQQAPSERDTSDRIVDALLVEVTRSIEAYRASQGGVQFDRIVVGGSVGIEQKLADALGARLQTTAVLYNPAAQFDWPEQRGEEARGFAAALGLAIGHADPDRLHFNFLDPKKSLTRTERRMRMAPAAGAAAALFVIAIIAFYFNYIRPKRAELAVLKAQARELREDLEDLEQFEETLAEVVSFEDEQVVWLDELDRIIALLPDAKDMVLKNLHMYQKGRRMTMQLEASDEGQISDLVARLKEFRPEGVETQYFEAQSGPTTRRGRGRYPVSGRIEVEVVYGQEES